MGLQFTAVVGDNRNRPVLVQNDVVSVFQFDQAQIVVSKDAFLLGFDLRLLETGSGRPTDMERPHRELRTRLADGLRGNNAHGFAQFNETSGGQIASVTTDADTLFAFTSEHRAYLHLLHAGTFDQLGPHLVNLLAGRRDDCLGTARIMNVVAGEAAHEAFAQLHHFIFAFIDGLDPNAIGSAAIGFADDHVLRHVHQLACHISRIGGLERRIRQTFPRAVGGNEIF